MKTKTKMGSDLALTFSRKTKRLTLKHDQATLRLTAEETTHLIRQCVELSHGSLVPVAPYVVTAKLDYSDYEPGGEQNTRTYHWCVAMADATLAEATLMQVRQEVSWAQFGSKVAIPRVPEKKFHVDGMKHRRSIESAMRSLRKALLEHQSDPVTDCRFYWQQLGLSRDQALELTGWFESLICGWAPVTCGDVQVWLREELPPPLAIWLNMWLAGVPADRLRGFDFNRFGWKEVGRGADSNPQTQGPA